MKCYEFSVIIYVKLIIQKIYCNIFSDELWIYRVSAVVMSYERFR